MACQDGHYEGSFDISESDVCEGRQGVPQVLDDSPVIEGGGYRCCVLLFTVSLHGMCCIQHLTFRRSQSLSAVMRINPEYIW